MIHLPPQLINSVVLKSKEKPLYIWRSNIIFDPNNPKEGYSIATNKRLIFLHETGLFSKKYSLIETIDYENIRGISVDGIIFKHIRLDAFIHGQICKPELTFKEVDKNTLQVIGKIDVEDIRGLLNMLIKYRVAAIEEEKRKSRIQYVMDFSFLKAEMEKGGITLTTIKCPSCGANVTLPKDGTSFICSYCKSTINAQDVFQKMKGLIQSL